MAEAINASDIISLTTKLKNSWNKRNTKFKDWYNLLRLNDEMQEENKESYVSNSPRTNYNLALHLMVPKVIPHKFPTGELSPEEIQSTSIVERMLARDAWGQILKQDARSGRQNWYRRLGADILAFGWYAVRVDITDERYIAEVLPVTEVYPQYSEEGMTAVAYIHTYSKKALIIKLTNMGLTLPKNISGDKFKYYDYYFIDDEGSVSRAIVVGTDFVMTPTKMPNLTYIPVFVSPVGGLPDEGAIDSNWQEHHGEAFLAVNEGIYMNGNRLASFLQQATREATEPILFEQSTGTEIVQPDDLSRHGVILRGSPQDGVSFLQKPAIPVELQQQLFKYDIEKQEGSFSPMMRGQLTVQVAAYTLSQMAEAAQQVMRPYHDAMKNVLTEIDNFWLFQMREFNVKPYGVSLPKYPEGLEIEVDYPITIPGDLINRATVARMMSPDIRFSQDTVMDHLFPEIMNPVAEQAKARKDMALMDPISIAVSQVVAYREAAALAKVNKNSQLSQLYEKAAEAVEAQITGVGQEPAGGGGTIGMPPGTSQRINPQLGG